MVLSLLPKTIFTKITLNVLSQESFGAGDLAFEQNVGDVFLHALCANAKGFGYFAIFWTFE
jgi:hypothetical protein